MAKIIAMANQKGGVGKTTTCVNLTCALSKSKKVLLCDMDPQGNSTSGMGINKNKTEYNIYDVMAGKCPAEEAIASTKYGDVLPSNRELSGASVELVSLSGREYVLKEMLKSVADRYDYILIDCPPSLELITLNALCAADSIIVPVQCEYYALEGLSDLTSTVRIVKRALNPGIEIEGVLLTMYDNRTNLSLQVAEEVRKYFKNKVYSTVIPRNVRLSEAPSHGKPAVVYDPGSRGALAYTDFAKEFLRKQRKG